MGDFNLSHRVMHDKEKLKKLCEDSKVSALCEITRSVSRNQLDYILIDNLLNESCYVTSYNNFISDHKSVTARIGLDGNEFTKEFKIRLTFDSESHLKSKEITSDTETDRLKDSLSNEEDTGSSQTDSLANSQSIDSESHHKSKEISDDAETHRIRDSSSNGADTGSGRSYFT